MSVPPSSPTGVLPFKISLFIGLGLTPLFYFILRSAYSAPTLSPGQMCFLWGYSFFCTFHAVFAQSQSARIQNHLPKWLGRSWVRFVVYILLVLALTALINLIRLPSFYDAVIGKSVIFLLLPYLIVSQRSGWTFGPPRSLPRSSLSGTNEELILKTKAAKGIFLLVVSVAFVAGGIFMLHHNAALAWLGIGFFGLGIPIAILMLVTGGYTLTLKRDEFTTTTLWRRYSFSWNDVSDFTVVNAPQGFRVGFNIRADLSENAPAWRKRIATRKWLVEMYGRNAILPDDYGVSADELCRILSARKAQAEQGG